MKANQDSIAAAIEALRLVFGDRLSTAAAVREQHGKDPTWHEGIPPDGVVFAESTAEVQAAMKICHTHGVPVIPYGVGTSLEGHMVIPPFLAERKSRVQAAMANFCFGVIPPSAI